jgi:hypothetical protein
VMTTLCGESSHHRPSNTRMRPPPSGFVQVGLSPAIGRSLQHVCRYESPKVVRCCRVDSAFAPTSKIVVSKAATIRPEPSGETVRTVLVKCGARLPIHLAHPLKDEHAVVIHALGPSLQGSRQNRGEPCRLFPADTPSHVPS